MSDKISTLCSSLFDLAARKVNALTVIRETLLEFDIGPFDNGTPEKPEVRVSSGVEGWVVFCSFENYADAYEATTVEDALDRVVTVLGFWTSEYTVKVEKAESLAKACE